MTKRMENPENKNISSVKLEKSNVNFILSRMESGGDDFQIFIDPIHPENYERFQRLEEEEVWEYDIRVGKYEHNSGKSSAFDEDATWLTPLESKNSEQMVAYLTQKFNNASITLRFVKK